MNRFVYHIPNTVQFIFVADLFADEYLGGAELTTEAIYNSCPGEAFKIHSSSVTPELINKNLDKHWILCNWTQISLACVSELVNKKAKYSVIEYDFKICRFRSPQLHFMQTNNTEECNCHELKFQGPAGILVDRFYSLAQHVFFMSEKQAEYYKNNTKFLSQVFDSKCSVLSSVWSNEDIEFINNLYAERQDLAIKDKWAVLSGGTWIKNQAGVEAYCKRKGMQYDLIGGLPYREFLKKMSEYKGLVFHPAGFDTAPRIVIEAKLLGLELDLNHHVLHKDESWFVGTREECLEFLLSFSNRIWSKLNNV